MTCQWSRHLKRNHRNMSAQCNRTMAYKFGTIPVTITLNNNAWCTLTQILQFPAHSSDNAESNLIFPYSLPSLLTIAKVCLVFPKYNMTGNQLLVVPKSLVILRMTFLFTPHPHQPPCDNLNF